MNAFENWLAKSFAPATPTPVQRVDSKMAWNHALEAVLDALTDVDGRLRKLDVVDVMTKVRDLRTD